MAAGRIEEKLISFDPLVLGGVKLRPLVVDV